MIPINVDAFRICSFLIGHDPDADFSQRIKNIPQEITIDRWDDPSPRPTDTAIVDAGNDLTVINGETFSQWLATHGGDPVLTLRREAGIQLDETSPEAVKARAVLTYMARQHNALLQWLGAQTSLANRAQLAGFKITRTGIKNAIAAGDGDI